MAPLGDHQPLSLSPFLGWIVTNQLSSGQLWWMNRSCIGWHSILKPIGASVFGSSDNGFNRWAWGLKGWSEKVGGESWLSISYKSSFSVHPFFLKVSEFDPFNTSLVTPIIAAERIQFSNPELVHLTPQGLPIHAVYVTTQLVVKSSLKVFLCLTHLKPHFLDYFPKGLFQVSLKVCFKF